MIRSIQRNIYLTSSSSSVKNNSNSGLNLGKDRGVKSGDTNNNKRGEASSTGGPFYLNKFRTNEPPKSSSPPPNLNPKIVESDSLESGRANHSATSIDNKLRHPGQQTSRINESEHSATRTKLGASGKSAANSHKNKNNNLIQKTTTSNTSGNTNSSSSNKNEVSILLVITDDNTLANLQNNSNHNDSSNSAGNINTNNNNGPANPTNGNNCKKSNSSNNNLTKVGKLLNKRPSTSSSTISSSTNNNKTSLNHSSETTSTSQACCVVLGGPASHRHHYHLHHLNHNDSASTNHNLMLLKKPAPTSALSTKKSASASTSPKNKFDKQSLNRFSYFNSLCSNKKSPLDVNNNNSNNNKQQMKKELVESSNDDEDELSLSKRFGHQYQRNQVARIGGNDDDDDYDDHEFLVANVRVPARFGKSSKSSNGKVKLPITVNANLPSLVDTDTYYPKPLFFNNHLAAASNTIPTDRIISKLNNYLSNVLVNKARNQIECEAGFTTKTSYNSSPVRVGGSPMQSRRKQAAQPSITSTHPGGKSHLRHHSNTGVSSSCSSSRRSGKPVSQIKTDLETEVFNIYGLIRAVPGNHSRPALPPCFKHRKWMIEPPNPLHIHHHNQQMSCYPDDLRSDRYHKPSKLTSMFNQVDYSSSADSIRVSDLSKLKSKQKNAKTYLSESNGSFEYKRNSSFKKSKYSTKHWNDHVINKLMQQQKINLIKYTNHLKGLSYLNEFTSATSTASASDTASTISSSSSSSSSSRTGLEAGDTVSSAGSSTMSTSSSSSSMTNMATDDSTATGSLTTGSESTERDIGSEDDTETELNYEGDVIDDVDYLRTGTESDVSTSASASSEESLDYYNQINLKKQRTKMPVYPDIIDPKAPEYILNTGLKEAKNHSKQQYTVKPTYHYPKPTPTMSTTITIGGNKDVGKPSLSSSFQKITRQDRMIFYEANSPLEETVKYEANLPQLPETTEIDLLKMKSGKIMENGVMPSIGGGMSNKPTIATSTPSPINILGTTSNSGNTIRTQYVKKKDIGHGLKSTLQQSEVKNLSVIAEETECLHSSSRNSVIDSAKSSASSSSSSSSTNVSCKIFDHEQTKATNESMVKSGSGEMAKSGSEKDVGKDSVLDSIIMKMSDSEPEFLEDEKGVMLVSAEEIYDKDTLIYI